MPAENQVINRAAAAEDAGRKPRSSTASKKRDDAIFEELIGPSQERVYRLALRITRNTEDAEDVQQETLLKVHRKLGQFEGRSRFTTWISRIAINEALMCLRKRRSAFYMPLEEAISACRGERRFRGFPVPHRGARGGVFAKGASGTVAGRGGEITAGLSRRVSAASCGAAVHERNRQNSANFGQRGEARMRRARSELREWLKEARRVRLGEMQATGADGHSSADAPNRSWLI